MQYDLLNIAAKVYVFSEIIALFVFFLSKKTYIAEYHRDYFYAQENKLNHSLKD